jgi:hypothetical protein
MSHNLFTLTAAAFLGIGTAAHQVGATAAPASLLALPLIYGSPKQVTANCSVTNSGFEPVTISAAQIDDSTGLSFALMANSCTGTLNPGLSCGMVANIFPRRDIFMQGAHFTEQGIRSRIAGAARQRS